MTNREKMLQELSEMDGKELFQALSMKRRANSHWKPMLILACITIVLGIIIVCNPFSTLNALTSVIGIVLAYDGVTRFLAAVRK